MEKIEISPRDAEERYGVRAYHERMPNGELRFRLIGNDGSGYIRTVTIGKVEWQYSHYHNVIRETFIVQKGWMAYAELVEGSLLLKEYGPSQILTTRPSIVHNIYMPADSVIHTVKHGSSLEQDRIPYPNFDSMTRSLSEEDIHNIAKKDAQ